MTDTEMFEMIGWFELKAEAEKKASKN